jgi:hypothetical protein
MLHHIRYCNIYCFSVELIAGTLQLAEEFTVSNLLPPLSCGIRTYASPSHIKGSLEYFFLLQGDFLDFYVLYLTLLHLPPLRFRCVGGHWDRTQDC